MVGVARGSGGGRSLLLNAHMDTVGVTGMERPHKPYVEGDRLYGRGAYDMKAGMAAIMLTGASAVEEGLRGDVIVTAVADEENASMGTSLNPHLLPNREHAVPTSFPPSPAPRPAARGGTVASQLLCSELKCRSCTR